MDRPLGPRQPDKRNAAYQDIFGRATHANPRPQQGYPMNAQYGAYPGPSTQPNPYAYGQPQPHSDRQSMYAQSVYNMPYAPPAQQAAPISYQHSYYTPSPQPHPLPHQPSLPQGYYQHQVPYAQSSYAPTPYTQPSMLAPMPPQQQGTHGRARSIASSRHVQSAVSPRPEEPPDPQIEAYIRAGMTPAQAYQQQVYQQQHTGSSPNLPRASHNGAPPSVGLSLDSDDGRLGLDFTEGDSSPGETDESSGSRRSTHNRRSISPAMSRRKSSTRLQVNTSLPELIYSPASAATSSQSHATTSTAVSSASTDMAGITSGRRSSESTRTVGTSILGGSHRRKGSTTSRSMSASVMGPSIRSMFDAGASTSRAQTASPASIRSAPMASNAHKIQNKGPAVYPAMLSRVALALRERISPGDRVKDGLTYTGAFDGREAVDRIAAIIKTSDRNLALLLGRALDAQKYFHDVTYDHRLRDSATELYQFRTNVETFAGDGDGDGGVPRPSISTRGSGSTTVTSAMSATTDGTSSADHEDAVSPSTPSAAHQSTGLPSDDDDVLPSGVFTLLTDCYSPTCSRDHLCYSIACPRRLEQQARLNLKPQPGLKKQLSQESIGQDTAEPGALWIHTVGKDIADTVSDTEKKRQEAINEVIYTEHDFVRDMEYLRDVWVNPLKASDVIPEVRRTDFLEQVFWNVHDIIAVNTRLRDALKKRQKHQPIVERVGDILADAVPHFAPFVSYGAHQLYGKFEFEKEKAANPAFAAFVETAERLPESRKLELNGYLTKPTTRLARYPLLLEAVLKHTPEDNPDKQLLPQVIILVREFLAKVNTESGKTENRFNLLQLDQQLVFRAGETVDLRLREEGRELVYKGLLKKRGNSQGDNGELQVFLFDHAVLMVKQKTKHEQYKVYRRPIPLELLVISWSDEQGGTLRRDPRARHSATNSRSSFGRNGPYPPIVPTKTDGKGGFSITFAHLGKKFYQMTLWAPTAVGQRKWVENINRQQELMRERSAVFGTDVLSEGFFTGPNKVNCAAPFARGRQMVYGTDDGVYMSNITLDSPGPREDPVKMLALSDVTQIDVLEEYQLLLVLSERQVFTFPLDALDSKDPMAGLKRAKRISSHTSFFKAGYCLGKAVVCVVKSSPLSSTIKALEPIDQNTRGRAKPTFKKLLQGGNDTLHTFREFYIPVESSSIHYMKTRLIVGCTKGFEIVDLETLDTQGLLNPADESLSFVSQRDTPLKPMAIYRIDSDFLLCYDEFAFYINKDGFRSRPQFMVHWEGVPTGFALQYPYVLAFEPTFVEIRHVETGAMAQIIQGNHLRLLFADMPPSTTHSAATIPLSAPSSQIFNPYAQQPQGAYPGQFGQQYGYPQGAYGYPTQPPPGSQYGRNGYNQQYGGYPQQVPPPPPPASAPAPTRGAFGRDEIVFVSDDRVMILRLVNGTSAAGGEDSPTSTLVSSMNGAKSTLPLPPPPVSSMNGAKSTLQLPPPPVSDAVSVYSMAR